jgi:hypothetical protein
MSEETHPQEMQEAHAQAAESELADDALAEVAGGVLPGFDLGPLSAVFERNPALISTMLGTHIGG